MSEVEHRIVNTEERVLELRLIAAVRNCLIDNKPGLGELLHDPLKDVRAAMEDLATWHGSDTHLMADVDQELHELGKGDEPEWVLRTWVDVRRGDHVRMPGTEHTAIVTGALHCPWHVHPAASQYRPNEMPAEWSEVRVTFDNGDSYSMNPAAAVEIELTLSEVAAIEALGWPNRIGLEIVK